MRKTLLLAFAVLILLAGCQPRAKGVLEGHVSIGPLCPVERIPPDPRCQPTEETYKAWPLAVTRNGVTVATITAGADGRFRVELSPGTYIVRLANPQQFGSGSLPATVTISSSETTTLDIDIDTGIR
jgi:hypothetical protein